MIPFLDLKAQAASLEAELMAAAKRVITSGQFVLGEEVIAFERELADWCGVRHSVGTSTGTSALHLALLAGGIGPGDEVITVPHTFVATTAAIRLCGATPVFVDVDPRSHTLDPARIDAALTAKTRAILPVHLYGQPADMDPIMAIATRHRLLVVEDACQAHGARYKGRPVGSIGHLAALSFYPGKNLGACGEAGAVLTNDTAFCERVKILRDWGQDRRYHHLVEGFNYRMDSIQAAFLRVKLPYLEAWTSARRRNAERYRELLTGADLGLPQEMPYSKHVYHLYAIASRHRDALQTALTSRGIGTGLHYPTPVHLQPCFSYLGYREGMFPNAERAAREELSLPMFAELTEVQLMEVAKVVREEARKLESGSSQKP